jgi:hypothetical protein
MSKTKTYWAPKSGVDYLTSGDGLLILNMDGYPFGGDEIRIEQPPGMSAEQMLRIANQIVNCMQEWRDCVAAAAEKASA